MVSTTDEWAGDLVRHAELAGEPALAARACVLAGERCLRLFAKADAMNLARRGRSHLPRLSDDRLRHELMISLFKVEVLAAAGPGMRPLPRIADELATAVAAAEAAGRHAAAATGHYLLSVLHQEKGNPARARQSTVRAVEAGREGDPQAHAQQVANTARCLLELEADIPRARTLLAQAGTLLGPRGRCVCELQWGQGLLARWVGDADEAATRLACALSLARDAEDRWRESKCLTWLALLEFERGRLDAARSRCRDVRAVAAHLGEADAPLADAIGALAEATEASEPQWDRLDAVLARLRAVDDKSHLAYALNAAAALCLARGPPETARAYAREALDAARAMQRQSEIAIAEAILAATAIDTSAAARVRPAVQVPVRAGRGERINARARALIQALKSKGKGRGGHACRASSSNAASRPR
jgi:hypothetical protein